MYRVVINSWNRRVVACRVRKQPEVNFLPAGECKQHCLADATFHHADRRAAHVGSAGIERRVWLMQRTLAGRRPR